MSGGQGVASSNLASPTKPMDTIRPSRTNGKVCRRAHSAWWRCCSHSRHHMAGNMWFDGFVVPWIADVMPQTLAAPKRGTLVIAALSSYLLLPLGWLLFGIASFRAVSTRGFCA